MNPTKTSHPYIETGKRRRNRKTRMKRWASLTCEIVLEFRYLVLTHAWEFGIHPHPHLLRGLHPLFQTHIPSTRLVDVVLQTCCDPSRIRTIGEFRHLVFRRRGCRCCTPGRGVETVSAVASADGSSSIGDSVVVLSCERKRRLQRCNDVRRNGSDVPHELWGSDGREPVEAWDCDSWSCGMMDGLRRREHFHSSNSTPAIHR